MKGDNARDTATPDLPPPPSYNEASNSYEQTQESQNFIPDDFKFSTAVVSCDPQIRQWFIRKVYTLLACQLTFSLLFSVGVSYSPSAQSFIINKPWLMILAIVGGLITCVWLSFAPRQNDDYQDSSSSQATSLLRQEEQQSRPWYYLSYRGQLFMLSLFTLCEAYSLSIVTLVYETNTVLSALFVTTVVVVGVTLLALSGKFESTVTSSGSIYYWLNMALWLLIGIGFSSLFFGMSSTMDLVYGWLGAIVFTIYLFIDTQLILRKVYPDEEIRCSMMLYLDIVNLFLYILRIMSHNDDNWTCPHTLYICPITNAYKYTGGNRVSLFSFFFFSFFLSK